MHHTEGRAASPAALALMALALVCAAACAVLSLRWTPAGADSTEPEEEQVLRAEEEDGSGRPDPAEAAAAFLDAVCACNYETANSMLYGYETLGLEKTPETDDGAAMWELLRSNTSWRAEGTVTAGSSTASVPVVLVYPDLAALTEGAGEAVEAILAEAVEAATYSNEIYDENGDYRQELVLQAYSAVMADRLAEADCAMTETPLTLHLTYDTENGCWLVIVDSALQSALTGGAA